MNISLAHLWFTFLHQNYLIYNMCWEDARIDRSLLKLDSNSKIMMISSAGCNALSYLLDQPKFVHTVDINPRQNALLELKIQIIRSGNYNTFYELFWEGKSDHVVEIYSAVKANLSEKSRVFWDDHLHYFKRTGNGLFFQGGAGNFARILNKIIDRKNLRSTIIALSAETDRTNRTRLFDDIETKLWSGVDSKIWPSHVVLSLAGIPQSQKTTIVDLNSFSKEVVQQIFIDQKADQNPYWGRYLKLPGLEPQIDDIHHPANFGFLQETIEKISVQTSSFNDYLDTSKEHYTHFILLDHMDWMMEKEENELTRLWNLILQRSEQDSKILFRTASDNLDFLPNDVFKQFDVQAIDKHWLQKNDRVGTYTGTYLAIKK